MHKTTAATRTHIDYSAYVLDVNWTAHFPEPGQQTRWWTHVKLKIERIEDPDSINSGCDTCTDNPAEYVVLADEHGGFNMFYCQEYMDLMRTDPTCPDTLMLKEEMLP